MKRPLNIALLGTRGIPNTYGGFEQCAEFLSQGLVKKGHQVSVYCSSKHSHKEDSWNNVNLVYCNDPEQLLGTSGQFIYDLNCILHARKQHYDIIVQFGYTSSSIWRWFWPNGAKHLVNMDGLEFLRTKYSLATKFFLRNAEKWAASGADMLIADNVGIEKYLNSKYPKSDIRCITYGAKTPMPPKNIHETLGRFNLVSKDFDLVICRIEPENSVETILKAYVASKSPRKLVIVGNTSNKFAERMAQQFQSDKIIFTQGVYDTNALNILRSNCELYLHGHTVGGTNPSLLEAMNTASKIIAHNNEFNRSVLENNALYFDDHKGLAQILSMNTNIIHDHLVKTISKIEQFHQWDQIIDKYENAFYELV